METFIIKLLFQEGIYHSMSFDPGEVVELGRNDGQSEVWAKRQSRRWLNLESEDIGRRK